MTNHHKINGNKTGLFQTNRFDYWWVQPLLTGLGFSVFVVYTTWSMLQGEHYWWSAGRAGFGGYLSPFYSPLFFLNPIAAGSAPLEHAWFGIWPNWMPNIIPITPAILILAAPLSFRLSCYYYRKFYYRAYFLTPPACAVKGISQKHYKGETALLLIQNIHRFTLYIAIGIIVILSYDALLAFFQGGEIGIGIGSVILFINPLLLAGYTFGCHAFRHLVGGRLNCFTCPNGNEKIRYKFWKIISLLNGKHMFWAWTSMIWVAVTDIYVRMVSMGYWIDLNTWGN